MFMLFLYLLFICPLSFLYLSLVLSSRNRPFFVLSLFRLQALGPDTAVRFPSRPLGIAPPRHSRALRACMQFRCVLARSSSRACSGPRPCTDPPVRPLHLALAPRHIYIICTLADALALAFALALACSHAPPPSPSSWHAPSPSPGHRHHQIGRAHV